MLMAQVASTPTRVSLGDVLALLVDAEMQDIGRPAALSGYAAEALFNTLNPDGFIYGFQATSRHVALRRELHRAGSLVVSYDYTTASQRELRFWPHRAATHLRSQLEEEARELHTQGWSVLRFVPKDQASPNYQGDHET
jgi:hypothetical protein